MANEIMDELRETVRAQQKGHKDDDVFTVGEQLMEIAEREPASAELLANDLKVDGMGLADAAKALRDYAGKNRKAAGPAWQDPCGEYRHGGQACGGAGSI